MAQDRGGLLAVLDIAMEFRQLLCDLRVVFVNSLTGQLQVGHFCVQGKQIEFLGRQEPELYAIGHRYLARFLGFWFDHPGSLLGRAWRDVKK